MERNGEPGGRDKPIPVPKPGVVSDLALAFLILVEAAVAIFVRDAPGIVGVILVGLLFHPLLESRRVKSGVWALVILAIFVGVGLNVYIGGYRISYRYLPWTALLPDGR